MKGGDTVDAYIERHILRSEYRETDEARARYENMQGWTDYRIGRHIVFAHRENDYDRKSFRDALHAHDYCEVLFYCGGDVQYVSRDRTEAPKRGSVIVIPPRTLHTTRLLFPSRYERYVLYLGSEAFSGFGDGWSAYLRDGSPAFSCTLGENEMCAVYGKLGEIENALGKGTMDAEIASYAHVIDILLVLRRAFEGTRADDAESAGGYLPEPIREMRRYVEENYASIRSVEALAEHFYYTREYVTRIFRRYYNLSPGDYIEQCRIREAEIRIADGERVADACFAVGYRSISAFSSAFRRVTGKPPSAFRRR